MTTTQRQSGISPANQNAEKSSSNLKSSEEALPRIMDLKKCTVAAIANLESMSESNLRTYCKQMHQELSESCRLLSLLKELMDYALDMRPAHAHVRDPALSEFLEIRESLTISYENGVYTGQSIFGKANGQGVCMFADGSRYSGQWKNNHMHGKGTINFPSGEYTGDFENGQYCGSGEYAYHHGQRYLGQYKQGQQSETSKFYGVD